VSRNHHSPGDPRDGSDPYFASALAKKLSNLSVSSSREESSSSGFFSTSSASDDICTLEEDEEIAIGEEGSTASGDVEEELNSLESLTVEESDSESSSESESESESETESDANKCPEGVSIYC
jgi:hypothetical protein